MTLNHSKSCCSFPYCAFPFWYGMQSRGMYNSFNLNFKSCTTPACFRIFFDLQWFLLQLKILNFISVYLLLINGACYSYCLAQVFAKFLSACFSYNRINNIDK